MYVFDIVENIFDVVVYIHDIVEYIYDNVENIIDNVENKLLKHLIADCLARGRKFHRNNRFI